MKFKEKMRLGLALMLLITINGCGRSLSSREEAHESTDAGVRVGKSKSEGSVVVLGGMKESQAISFTEALKKADISTGPILRAGRLEQEENWQEAIAAYKDAMMNKEYAASAKIGLARIYEKTMRYDDAIEQLEEALPMLNDWARPEYEAKLTALKAKAATQSTERGL